MAERERWPALLSKELTAEYLDSGTRTIDRMMADGTLVPVKMRGMIKFRRDDLDAYIESLPRGDSSRDIAARTPGRRGKRKHGVAGAASVPAGSAAS